VSQPADPVVEHIVDNAHGASTSSL
jgi:hypothetical protein